MDADGCGGCETWQPCRIVRALPANTAICTDLEPWGHRNCGEGILRGLCWGVPFPPMWADEVWGIGCGLRGNSSHPLTYGFNCIAAGSGGDGPSGLEAKYDLHVFRCVSLHHPIPHPPPRHNHRLDRSIWRLLRRVRKPLAVQPQLLLMFNGGQALDAHADTAECDTKMQAGASATASSGPMRKLHTGLSSLRGVFASPYCG